ncbi:unnamed protein product, partial [Timema podura]|nr:unnamed protein product [Timema podura]
DLLSTTVDSPVFHSNAAFFKNVSPGVGDAASDPDSSNDGLDTDKHSNLVGWTSFTFPGIKEEIKDEPEVFGRQDDLESFTHSTTNFEKHLIKTECTEDITLTTNKEQTSNKSLEIKEENSLTQDDTISEGGYKESDQQTDKIFYSCIHCDRSFSKIGHLSLHEKGHIEEKPHVCRECGKCFKFKVCDRCLKLKYDFTQRILVRKRKDDYKCEECDVCFKTRGDLQVHTREHRYDCDRCGRCFKTKHMLAVHSCAANPKERPHKCNVCNKRFLKEKDVARHKIQNHTNKHLCENCGKCFSLKDKFLKHTIIHGARPFKCNVCDLSFKWKKVFNKHICTPQ